MLQMEVASQGPVSEEDFKEWEEKLSLPAEYSKSTEHSNHLVTNPLSFLTVTQQPEKRNPLDSW